MQHDDRVGYCCCCRCRCSRFEWGCCFHFFFLLALSLSLRVACCGNIIISLSLSFFRLPPSPFLHAFSRNVSSSPLPVHTTSL